MKIFYFPPNSDPLSEEPEIEQKVEINKEEQLSKADGLATPFETPLDQKEADTNLPISLKKGKPRVKTMLPPTLLSPICHMSNPNPPEPPQICPTSRRMITFSPNSPRLGRARKFLAIINKIHDPDLPDEPEAEETPSSFRNGTATRWAHLPVEERRKSFARPQPPEAVKPRSPVEGLSTKMIVRVCFRVGEAIRFASMQLNGKGNLDKIEEKTDVLTELFGWCTLIFDFTFDSPASSH